MIDKMSMGRQVERLIIRRVSPGIWEASPDEQLVQKQKRATQKGLILFGLYFYVMFGLLTVLAGTTDIQAFWLGLVVWVVLFLPLALWSELIRRDRPQPRWVFSSASIIQYRGNKEVGRGEWEFFSHSKLRTGLLQFQDGTQVQLPMPLRPILVLLIARVSGQKAILRNATDIIAARIMHADKLRIFGWLYLLFWLVVVSAALYMVAQSSEELALCVVLAAVLLTIAFAWLLDSEERRQRRREQRGAYRASDHGRTRHDC